MSKNNRARKDRPNLFSDYHKLRLYHDRIIRDYIAKFIEQWQDSNLCKNLPIASQWDVKPKCHYANYVRHEIQWAFLWVGFRTQDAKSYEQEIDTMAFEMRDVKDYGVTIGIRRKPSRENPTKESYVVIIYDTYNNIFNLGVRYTQEFSTFELMTYFLDSLLEKL